MQVVAIVRYNFRGFWKNPKSILTFLLGFVLCYLLSARVMEVIETYHTAGPGRRTIPLDIWGCRGDLAQFGVAAASVLGFAKAWQHDTVLSVPDDETGLVDGAVCVCHLRVDALYGISVSDDGYCFA